MFGYIRLWLEVIFTGLFNRDSLVKYLKELIELKSKFVLILVDIKDLSLINLIEGSSVGDKIILKTADYIKSLGQVTHFDILAPTRVGGDSFMFILVYEKRDQIHIIENYLKRLNNKVISQLSSLHPINLQYSITYARYPDDGASPDELIYVCKRKKKDGKVVV